VTDNHCDKHYKHYISSKCNLQTLQKGCDFDRHFVLHFVLHFCSQKTETRQKCAELATKAQITSFMQLFRRQDDAEPAEEENFFLHQKDVRGARRQKGPSLTLFKRRVSRARASSNSNSEFQHSRESKNPLSPSLFTDGKRNNFFSAPGRWFRRPHPPLSLKGRRKFRRAFFNFFRQLFGALSDERVTATYVLSTASIRTSILHWLLRRGSGNRQLTASTPIPASDS